MVCNRLLSDGAGNDVNGVNNNAQRTQSQFFAAQTLHAKCLADVHQLPPLSLPSLRNLLLSHFARHADRNARARAKNRLASRRLIVTRLSMVVSALSVHMGWTTCPSDVTEAVLRPNPRLGPAVLELFRDVPKEADSGWLVMAGDDGVGGNGSGGGGRLRVYRTTMRNF